MLSQSITNAPQNLDMISFRAISNKYGSLMKGGKFAVRINPVGKYVQSNFMQRGLFQDLTYLCEVAEMPGRQFMNMDIRYYGPNYKLPFQTVYEDITLTFICRSESVERRFFDNWMQIINPTTHFDFTYRDDYKCTIEIFQYADYSDDMDDFIPTYKVTLEDAYPIAITPQPLVWTDNQFQKLLVNFTYARYVREDFVKPTQSVDWKTNTPSTDPEERIQNSV